jgi:16S rRNA (cytosine967-C5)-methyltransferase
LPQENEEIAEIFSANHPEFSPLPVGQVLEGLKVPEPAQLCAGGNTGLDYLRLWPHLHATDGFFAAVWQKK